MAPLLTTPPDSPDLFLPESGWDLHIGRGSRAETTGWRPALEVHTGDGLIDVAVAGGLDQTLLRGALRGRRTGRRQGRWGADGKAGRWALAWGHLPADPPGPPAGTRAAPRAGAQAGTQDGAQAGPQAGTRSWTETGDEPWTGRGADPTGDRPAGTGSATGSEAVEVIVEFRGRRTTHRVKATAIAGAFWVAEAPGGFRSVAVSTGPRRAAARLRRYRPGN